MRCLERARSFFDRSIETLERFPTKSTTRPVSLCLRAGFVEAWVAGRPGEPRPEPE